MAHTTKSSAGRSNAQGVRNPLGKAARTVASSEQVTTAAQAFANALGIDRLAKRIDDLELRVAALDTTVRFGGRWRLKAVAKRGAAKRAPRRDRSPSAIAVDSEPPGPPVGD
jgi:hypothetical protein